MSIKNTMVNGYKKKLRLVSFAICYIIWQFSLPSGMAAHEWDLKMIGDACSSDKECADLFSVCASGICSCDTAYHKIHFFSACNDERKLGDLCTSDKDCTIPHSYCFMNSCVCKSGYVKELLSTEYSCTKYGERAFNEECSTDEECPPLDASCSNGICSCNPGYRKEYFHGYFFCIRAENHDVTTLETDSSATFEHLKLGFSKWPFIAAIVVALLILAICIYFCLRCRRRNQQQQPQPAVNYQSCPQASGGPVISGVSSQQVNYPPYPVTPGYPGYGGPTPTSGHGGPLPAGGYFPSGAQGYYGPPKPGEHHGYPPMPAYANYSNTSQTEQFQSYPPVSGPPLYGNPPQMGGSYSTGTSSIASPVQPSAPPDNGDNRQDPLPPYYSTQGSQPVQPK